MLCSRFGSTNHSGVNGESAVGNRRQSVVRTGYVELRRNRRETCRRRRRKRRIENGESAVLTLAAFFIAAVSVLDVRTAKSP